MQEEKPNLRSKDIKGTETYGKRPATMNQTHQVIGTCAAHISWNLRSRDSEVESPSPMPSPPKRKRQRIHFVNYLDDDESMQKRRSRRLKSQSHPYKSMKKGESEK